MKSTDTTNPTGMTTSSDAAKEIMSRALLGLPATGSCRSRRNIKYLNGGAYPALWSSDGAQWLYVESGEMATLDNVPIYGAIQIKNVTAGQNISGFHFSVWEV